MDCYLQISNFEIIFKDINFHFMDRNSQRIIFDDLSKVKMNFLLTINFIPRYQ